MTGAKDHPPYVEMLDAALHRANHGEKVSRQRIASYLRDNYAIKTDTQAYKTSVKAALDKRIGQGYYAQDKNSYYFTDTGDEFYRGEYETSSEQEPDEEPAPKPVKSKKVSESKKAGAKGK